MAGITSSGKPSVKFRVPCYCIRCGVKCESFSGAMTHCGRSPRSRWLPERSVFISPRMLLAAKLVSQGLADKEIAAAMDISPDGVRSTLNNLRAKLGKPHLSRVMLAKWYEEYVRIIGRSPGDS